MTDLLRLLLPADRAAYPDAGGSAQIALGFDADDREFVVLLEGSTLLVDYRPDRYGSPPTRRFLGFGPGASPTEVRILAESIARGDRAPGEVLREIAPDLGPLGFVRLILEEGSPIDSG